MKVGQTYIPYKKFIGAYLPNWLLKRTELNGNDKVIFARLCQYAGENGKCFPKQKILAIETGLKEETIRKILKKLRVLKLIKAKTKKGINEYIFLTHKWVEDDGYVDTSKNRCVDTASKKNRYVDTSDNRYVDTAKNRYVHTSLYKEINTRDNKKSKSLLSKDNKEASETEATLKKPCDKYNYTYTGEIKDSTFSFRMNQTKNSYVNMLECDYGITVSTTFEDNLLNGKEKYFKALTTFLLEWNKETPNKVNTFKDLVKSYFRNIFVSPEGDSKHNYYKTNHPKPHQIITNNSIDLWHEFWIDNPLLQIKSKELSLEVKKQQAKEIKKYKWHLEGLKRYMFDNSIKIFTSAKNKWYDLVDLRDEIEKFREESGVK